MAKSRNPIGKILILLIVVAAAAFGIFYWMKKDEKPPEISFTTVQRGNIIQSITATGILQAPTSVDVSSQISGKVIARNVDYNDRVKEGDVLCLIDPATYKSKFLQAEAQLANTKANHTLTRLNTERTRELFQKNLVSQADLDTAEAQLQQAEAQLQIQNANVETARLDLDRCTITAPITGIVLDRQTDVGKTVAASLNAPTLFTLITDLTRLEISADVSEADIGSIAVEQEVQFTVDAYPGRQFHGKVTQIRNLPKTAQSVVVYSTIISVNNADLRLKPGMTANVNIITARRDNVLKIANSALRARIPEKLTPAGATPNPDTSSKSGSKNRPDGEPRPNRGERGERGGGGGSGGGGNRDQMRSLFQDAGITMGQPATPEAIERFKALAAERKIELSERMLANLERRTGGAGNDAPVATTRTVYRIATPLPGLTLNAVTARFGISDGANTEVVEGLTEGEEIITSVYIPGSTSAAAPSGQAGGPFNQGGNRGGFGGGFR